MSLLLGKTTMMAGHGDERDSIVYENSSRILFLRQVLLSVTNSQTPSSCYLEHLVVVQQSNIAHNGSHSRSSVCYHAA